MINIVTMPDQNITNVFKALADQTRLDIVRKLRQAPEDRASCSQVSTCSSLSQPAMSHHFKKLVDAQVVIEKKIGTEKIYELNHEFLSSLGLDIKKF